MNVSISEIRIDGGTQSRACINEQAVADYAEAMQGGAEFPPVVAFFDGATYWLADGFHRYQACKRAGLDSIAADVRQGTQRDAILYSVGANASHGLRRTNDDKKRAVLVLLNDPEWSKWPQTKIAQACGVSQPFVSRLVSTEQPASYSQHKIRQVERSGATYQQDTSNIGKRTAPTVAEDQPPPAPRPDLRIVETAPADLNPVALGDVERRKIAKMPPDAMVDEIIGLRADLADERDKSVKLKRERDELAERLAEALAGDQGKTIGNLQKQLRAAKYARDEALTAAKRMEYRLKQAEKRVAELESLGIAV